MFLKTTYNIVLHENEITSHFMISVFFGIISITKQLYLIILTQEEKMY